MMLSGLRGNTARILLVDDNTSGLAARRSILEELGHSVQTCASGPDALQRCSTHAFDVVVTDYRMPHMNGVEFITELRKQYPRMPVILLSGFCDALGLNESSTGADVVIQKSSNEVGHLVRAVNRLVRKPQKKTPKSATPASDADSKHA